MDDDCFDDGDSGDETCFVIALGPEPAPNKLSARSLDSNGRACESSSSPTSIQDDQVVRKRSSSQASQASSTKHSNRSMHSNRSISARSVHSYQTYVEKSSSRSVAKSASRRMGRDEYARVLATTVENLKQPAVGPHQLEICSRTLRDLAAGVDAAVDQIAGCGALEVLLDRVPKYLAASPECTEQACRLLADVCEQNLQARNLVANKRAAHFFCKVITQNVSMYASVTESAVRALGASCAGGHDRNMALVRESSGIESILAAMRRWKETRSLQSVALRAIEQSTEGNSLNQMELSDYGGLQEIVSTMLYFAEDSRLQGYALSAMISICRSYEASRQELGEAGAIQSVTSALSMFTTRLDIASYGALAMRYLCMDSSNRQRFSEANGMTVLVNSMQSIAQREREVGNLPHKDGIAHCLLAIESAVTGNEANRQAATSMQNAAVIAHAAALYIYDARVSEHATQLLAQVYGSPEESSSQNSPGARKSPTGLSRLFTGGIGISGGSATIVMFIDVCVRIVVKHVVHENIVGNACIFFQAALDQGHGRAIVTHELFPELQDEIRKAVEIHSDVDGIAGEAIDLFSRLRVAAAKIS